MIKTKNLTKKFGNYTAVDNVNFEIHTGEIVGLLGPNGAGKTTTMRMLAGYLVPDGGEIEINGKSFEEAEFELKNSIGYMPENNPIYKEMLVRELLELTLELNHIPKKDWKENIDYVLKATGIVDKYYLPIDELSKGYKQRVGIAQALINKPNILILDEPTEGLDPNQRNEIRNLVKEVGEKKTVIISTHVMQEVEAMCNRIIIINEGKIIADGSIEDIRNKVKGDKTITIEVNANDLKRHFEKLNFIEKISEEKSNKHTTYKLKVKTEEDEDKMFSEITKLLFKNNTIIYKLEMSEQKLEDIFYKLTTHN
ncbi:ATP-binding cassette domain-containing protein [Candidatus Dojkabacteria bacterium]|nr:ATP-binding cassette domain-containing protein [Candidatus Dojkabacteria bacterium]